MLNLLIFLLGVLSSVALQFGLSSSQNNCAIEFPFSSPYISAYYEQEIQGKGCTTRNVTAGDVEGMEVHVINLLSVGPVYRMNKFPQASVDLTIRSYSNKFSVLSTPTTFVLNSPVPIQWRVRFDIISDPKIRHIFVVPDHSAVKVVKGRQRRPIERMHELPRKSDRLLQWARREQTAVTSFTEVEVGNKIEVEVHIDDRNRFPTQCNFTSDPKQLRVKSWYKRPRLFSGCAAEDNHERKGDPAYVIELDNIRGNATTEVLLDIKAPGKRSVKHKLFLVLKAPPNVVWHIKTGRKITGVLDVIANRHVKEKIKVMTAYIQMDDLTNSKEALITWVNEYKGPVALYAGIDHANKIVLTLPAKEDSTNSDKDGNAWILSVFDPSSRGKSIFKRAVQTECRRDGRMLVTFNRFLVQKFGLKLSQLTLKDLSCTASENRTRDVVILGNSPSSCGTTMVIKENKKKYLVNKLFIHRTAKPEHSINENGSGDGFYDDEVEGSGLMEPNLDSYTDDEDLALQVIKVEVSCKIPEENETFDFFNTTDMNIPIPDGPDSWNGPGDVKFQLDMYKDCQYLNPTFKLPWQVDPGRRFFIQASVSSPGRELRAVVDTCWLGLHMNSQNRMDQILIRNGCKVDSSLQCHNQMNMMAILKSSYANRFSFKVWQGFGPHFYLKCHMTACRERGLDTSAIDNIPMCASIPPICHCHDNKSVGGSHSYKKVVLGPIYVTKTQEKSQDSPQDCPQDEPKKDFSGHPIVIDKPSDPKVPVSSHEEPVVVVEGLESTTVVSIAFAAFIIGVILMAALWFIHTHTGPKKQAAVVTGVQLDGSGESTPMSTAPITVAT